jgi:uncharacterized damage-inducible protein DinB
MDLAVWFSREFSFDHLPVWLYPSVVERVRGTPARLDDLTRGLPSDVLTRRDGDKWSIQEHAGHLLDLESLGMDRLDDFEAGVKTLRVADLNNRKTHEANHNANSIEAILSEFRAERAAFTSRLDAYDEEFIQRTGIHPRLQKEMRVIDLAYFIAEHDDHHLARISEMKQMFTDVARLE